MSRDSYTHLKRHLQEKHLNVLLNIIQEHLFIDGKQAFWVIFHTFLLSADFFFKINIFKKDKSGFTGDKNISILHLSCRTSDLQF